MSTLTDRYVWGVLQAVPSAQRRELEPEIRAMVGDAVEARQAAGARPEAAERSALEELGDPELLAARYTDRTLALIGPRYYPDWRRLLSLVLPIVVPITILAVGGAGYLAGQSAPELVGSAVSVGFNVAVQLAFWITLAFALLERSGRPSPMRDDWTPDELPELPSGRTESPIGLAIAVVAIVVGALLLAWQQVATPAVIDGVGYPLFNPALWSSWMPYFLVLLGIELAAILWRWRAGGWTWPLAFLNLATNIAFVGPALWLFTSGQLFDPGLVAAMTDLGAAPAFDVLGRIIPVIIVIAVGWDAIDGFRQAWMRSRGA
jgi:hypothetical protein